MSHAPYLPPRTGRTTLATLCVVAIGIWAIVLPLELLIFAARA